MPDIALRKKEGFIMRITTRMVTLVNGIRAALFDSDGVMFPNTVLMGAPYKAKYRSYYDGQGISLLRAVGIRVAFITNEKGDSAAAIRETVAKFNALPSSAPQTEGGWAPVALYEGYGGPKKVEAAQHFLAQSGCTPEQSSYMGDDLVDVPLLRAVALPAAPAQAEEVVKQLCLFVSEREGGTGAIRDFANMILSMRNIDPTTLPTQ